MAILVCEHLYQAPFQSVISGLLLAVAMSGVKTRQNIATGTRLCGKLGEKRSDQVTPVLFVDVSEIEIKVCNRCLTGIAHGFHIFDDRRTRVRQATQLSLAKQ
jgi:hypothetical protein